MRLLLRSTLLILRFGAYRLQMLLNKDSKRITLKDAYLITLIGAALNMVIPATMGDIRTLVLWLQNVRDQKRKCSPPP